MAELTGIEPVPAERQSAILPIDHSSGSLPWTRTTISAVRAQRPSIRRRGNFEIVKELAAGERFERPYPDSKSRVLPLDDPASSCERYRFHAPYAQHRRVFEVIAQPLTIRAGTVDQLAVIGAALTVQFGRNLKFQSVKFNGLHIHNLVAAGRIELPSQP